MFSDTKFLQNNQQPETSRNNEQAKRFESVMKSISSFDEEQLAQLIQAAQEAKKRLGDKKNEGEATQERYSFAIIESELNKPAGEKS